MLLINMMRKSTLIWKTSILMMTRRRRPKASRKINKGKIKILGMKLFKKKCIIIQMIKKNSKIILIIKINLIINKIKIFKKKKSWLLKILMEFLSENSLKHPNFSKSSIQEILFKNFNRNKFSNLICE